MTHTSIVESAAEPKVDSFQSAGNAYRVAVCIPTYNNGASIVSVVQSAKRIVGDVIVVIDGSTDDTHELLKDIPGIILLSFSENRGKGCALREGFSQARALGFSHVITMDGDGQHCEADLPAFLNAIVQDPSAVWVGNRVLTTDGTPPPARSRLGRKFSNFWFKFNTGIRLNDTQCGYRVYPVMPTHGLAIRGSRYEFEQEALIRAAWSGMPVKELDIHLNYEESAVSQSHFRPVRDFIRISKVNSRAAIMRVLIPGAPLDIPGKNPFEKIKNLVLFELRLHSEPAQAAKSVAFGTFIGLMPIHGFQMFVLMAVCVPMRLNRPLAFLGVSISSWPFMPFIIVCAVAVGRLVLPHHFFGLTLETSGAVLRGVIEFAAGSVVLAIVVSMVTYVTLKKIFSVLQKKRNKAA
jgi:glycosyltransferase involved in cell wall biosynthesis